VSRAAGYAPGPRVPIFYQLVSQVLASGPAHARRRGRGGEDQYSNHPNFHLFHGILGSNHVRK
jgi:hypothetical protein